MANIDGNDLMAFKAISAFVADLAEEFRKNQRSLALYQRLLEKTSIIHEEAISKHLKIFKEFVQTNREAIINQNLDKLTTHTLTYSDRVFINIAHIFRITDDANCVEIWKHLLTISAILDPESGAKETLKQNDLTSSQDCKAESNFLKDIINKVEDSIDPNTTNPTEAIGKVMSSGVLTELMTSMTQGMENGNLDIGNLMGSIQGMIGELHESGDVPPEMQVMTNSLSQMMSVLPKVNQ